MNHSFQEYLLLGIIRTVLTKLCIWYTLIFLLTLTVLYIRSGLKRNGDQPSFTSRKVRVTNCPSRTGRHLLI